MLYTIRKYFQNSRANFENLPTSRETSDQPPEYDLVVISRNDGANEQLPPTYRQATQFYRRSFSAPSNR